jgi:hypothetical protein
MAIQTIRYWHVMKTCGVSGAWDVPHGNGRSATIVVARLKTAISRIKPMFGNRVHARTFAGQNAEMRIGYSTLHRITHLGMPDIYAM